MGRWATRQQPVTRSNGKNNFDTLHRAKNNFQCLRMLYPIEKSGQLLPCCPVTYQSVQGQLQKAGLKPGAASSIIVYHAVASIPRICSEIGCATLSYPKLPARALTGRLPAQQIGRSFIDAIRVPL